MSYLNGLLSDQSYQTANKYVQRGLPGIGFKLTDTGDYDMQNKKLTNVKSGTDSNDAVNKSQLDATIISHIRNWWYRISNSNLRYISCCYINNLSNHSTLDETQKS